MAKERRAGSGAIGPGKATFTIYCDKVLLERIDRIAAAQDVSRSRYVESVLLESVAGDEVGVRFMTDPVVGPAMMSALTRPEVVRAMMGAFRTELNDDQLHLFQETMANVADRVAKKVGRRKRAGSAAPPKPRNRRK